MILTPEEIKANEENPYVPIKVDRWVCNECGHTHVFDVTGRGIICAKCSSDDVTQLPKR